MTICIYKITNLVNGKKYVGQTVDYTSRIYQHFYRTNTGCTKLKRSINRHGKDIFVCEILEQFEDELDTDSIKDWLNVHEQYWMDLLQPFDDNGYNINRYSEKSSLGLKRSDETKQKVSEGLKKYYKNNEASFKGRKHSEESNEKNRQAHLGKKHTKETRKKVSDAGKGRKHTQETKQKMSESAKNRLDFEETVSKMQQARMKKVVQLTLDGDFLSEYNSITEASVETNINRTCISDTCNDKQKTAGGYKWRYFKDFPK